MKKRLAAALSVVALGVGAAAAPAASAQPQDPPGPPIIVGQAGLVNVAVVVGDVELLNENNIAIGVAANVAAQVCDNQIQVGVLAVQVAEDGTGTTTCEIGEQTGTVTITQNQ
jgi:hypothetical protein